MVLSPADQRRPTYPIGILIVCAIAILSLFRVSDECIFAIYTPFRSRLTAD